MDNLGDVVLGGQSPAALPPQDNLGEVILGDGGPESAPLGLSVDQGRAMGPDKAARILKVQALYGKLPSDMVERNLDALEAEAAKQDFDPAKFRQVSPIVAKWWAESPVHPAVSLEDARKLGQVEAYLTRPSYLWPRSEAQLQQSAALEAKDRADAFLANLQKVDPYTAAKYDRGALEKDFTTQALKRMQDEEAFIAGDKPVGAFESLGQRTRQNPVFLIPFLSSAADAAHAVELYQAAKAVEAGKATPAQADRVLRFARLNEAGARRGETFMAKVADVVAALPAFGGEIAATGGLGNIAKGGAQKAGLASVEATLKAAAEKVAKEGVWRNSLKYAAELPSGLAKAAAMTATAGGLRIAQGTAQRMTPELQGFRPTADGGLEVQLQGGSGESFPVALGKSTVEQFAEVGSEITGGAFEFIDEPVSRVLFKRWMAKYPGEASRVLGRITKAAHLEGVPAEMLEERVGDLIKAVGGLQPFSQVIPSGEQLAVEAVSFGLPGAAQVPLSYFGQKHAEAQDARAHADALVEAGKQVQAMKARKAAPEALGTLFQQMRSESDSPYRYLDPATLEAYFADKKTEDGRAIDARAVAADLMGDNGEAFDEAKRLRHELEIPIDRYLMTLGSSEHSRFFADELRAEPGVMNRREAEDYFTANEKPAEEPTMDPTGPEAVGEIMRKQLTAEGLPQDEVDDLVALEVARLRARMQSAVPGVTAMDKHMRRPLEIQSEAMDELRGWDDMRAELDAERAMADQAYAEEEFRALAEAGGLTPISDIVRGWLSVEKMKEANRRGELQDINDLFGGEKDLDTAAMDLLASFPEAAKRAGVTDMNSLVDVLVKESKAREDFIHKHGRGSRRAGKKALKRLRRMTGKALKASALHQAVMNEDGPQVPEAERAAEERDVDYIRRVHWVGLTPEQRAEAYIMDPTAGVLSERAFELVRKTPPADRPMVFHASLSGQKLINDTYHHEAGDDFLTLAGQTLMRAMAQLGLPAEVYKDGADFVGFIKDQAQLDQVVAAAQAMLPEKVDVDGHVITGKVFTFSGIAVDKWDKAREAHGNWKKDEEAAGRRLPRTDENNKPTIPPGFKEFKGETAPAVEKVPPHIPEAVVAGTREALAEDEAAAFKKIYVRADDGQLTYEGQLVLPERASKGSADLDGLKAANDILGHENGNIMLQVLSSIMVDVREQMGAEAAIDLVHKSGDEYMSFSDDAALHARFWQEVERRALAEKLIFNVAGPATNATMVLDGLTFSVGIGGSNVQAEERLIGNKKLRSDERAGFAGRIRKYGGADQGGSAGGESYARGAGAGRRSGVQAGDDGLGAAPGAPGYAESQVRGMIDRATGRTLNQSAPVGTSAQTRRASLYSRLTQTIEQKLPATATVEQVRGIVRELPAEERKWLGLDDFLADKKKVSKDALLEFLRANALQIRKVEKRADRHEKWNEVRDQLDANLLAILALGYDGEEGPQGPRLFDATSSDRTEIKREDLPAEVRAALDERIRLFERLKEVEAAGEPKFQRYKLRGGSNYRENLYVLPSKNNFQVLINDEWQTFGTRKEALAAAKATGYDLVSNPGFFREVYPNDRAVPFRSTHWGEENVFAHSRLEDREIPLDVLAETMPDVAARLKAEGKTSARALHIVELQSDWHQKGRDEGYKGDTKVPEIEVTKEGNYWNYNRPDVGPGRNLNGSIVAWKGSGWEESGKSFPDGGKGFRATFQNKDAEFDTYEQADSWLREVMGTTLSRVDHAPSAVPDAPFRKTWHEFLLKNVLLEASGAGYDVVTWDVGDVQADRYSLDKHIGKLEYEDGPNGVGNLRAFSRDGRDIVLSERVAPDKLADYIGKEAAQKLLAQPEQTSEDRVPGVKFRTLEGVELRVGGEGMRGFYDKIVPDFARKFGKKFGAEVGQTRLVDTKQDKVGRPDLRLITDGEWEAFQGADEFKDGSRPLIAEVRVAIDGAAEPATLVASREGINIITMDGEAGWFRPWRREPRNASEAGVGVLNIFDGGSFGGFEPIMGFEGDLEIAPDDSEKPAHIMDVSPELRAAATTQGFPLWQSAWHGSPHKFSKFMLAHIGSGEGAQVKGWGLYFAGKREVGEWYRDELSPPADVYIFGKKAETRSAAAARLSEISEEHTPRDAQDFKSLFDRLQKFGSVDKVKAELEWMSKDEILAKYPAAQAGVVRELELLNMAIEKGAFKVERSKSGQLYNVDIPEDSELLDYDKLLSEQPAGVRKKLKPLIEEVRNWTGKKPISIEEGLGKGGDISGGGFYDGLKLVKGSPEAASKALLEAGIPGLRYLDGGSRAAGEGSHNYVIWDEQAIQILNTLNQDPTRGKKSRASFTPRGGALGDLIRLLTGRDRTSPVHELYHRFFFEMHDDVQEILAWSTDESKYNPAQKRLLADYKAALARFGVERFEDLTDEHLEQLAKWGEQYMFEGKAPSADLVPLMQRFRAWFLAVYKSLQRLIATGPGQLPLDPEIRGILDRMLASQEEIDKQAQAQGLEPIEGLDDADYLRDLAAVREEAETALMNKTIARQAREKTAAWKEERERFYKAAVRRLGMEKVYQTMEFLRHGTGPDGEALPEGVQAFKLSKADLDARGWTWRLKKLRPYVYAAEGGVSLEEAAQFFGWGSPEEMVAALEDAKPIEKAAAEEADAAMKSEHGDLMMDGAMVEEARKAIHNDKRPQLLRREWDLMAQKAKGTMKGLIRMMVRKPPSTEEARKRAEEFIAKQRVASIRPDRYLVEETKARREAGELFTKGDVEGALAAKAREMQNHEIYRAAVAAREAVDKTLDYVRYLAKDQTRERIGKAGDGFLEQMDAILDRFEFRRSVSMNQMQANRESLAKFLAKLEAQGEALDVPAYVENELYRKHYRELPYEQMVAVRDTLKQLEHAARQKNKMIADERGRDLREVNAEMTAAMGAHHDLTAKPHDLHPGLAARFKRGLSKAAAWHTRMEFFFKWLDGEENGPVYTTLFLPFAKSEDTESGYRKDVEENLNRIFGVYTRAERAKWFLDRTHIPELEGGRILPYLTKANMLAVALNVGNDYNLQALKDGYGWTDAQLQAVLDRLDERDWKVVREVWRYIDTFWPAIEKQERELKGVAPQKVEGRMVRTKFGSFMGGYYPIVFDADQSWRQHQLEEKQSVQEMFGKNWARAMTRHGHTKERTNTGGKPLKLELTGLTNHLANVIHDLSFRTAVINANRIIESSEFRHNVEAVAGRDMYAQLRPWLAGIAGDRGADAMNPIESMFSYGRSSATVVSLGLKLTSAMVQTLGYLNTIQEVGPRYAAAGLADAFGGRAGFGHTWDFITERSAMMKARMQNYDRDVRDVGRQLGVAGTRPGVAGAVDVYTHNLKQAYFIFTGYMDLATSVPTWLAAYRRAMDGAVQNIGAGQEAEAIAYADSVVRMTQSAGSAKDLAGIQRGSETFKLFTMFYSQLALQYNLMQKAVREFKTTGNLPALAGSAALLWFIPAVLEELIRGHGPDDDKWGKWLVKQELFYPFQTVVGVRDISNALERYVDTGRVDYAASPAFDAVESAVRAMAVGVKAAEGKDISRADAKGLAIAAGYAFQLPARQLWLSAEYLHDWISGEQRPDNAAEGVYRLLVTGKKKP